MGKRFEQKASEEMLRVVEVATGTRLSPQQREVIARGADEVDLVNSGLEETMVTAYDQIRGILRKNHAIQTLCTAAFVSAINRIATSYAELGIFP